MERNGRNELMTALVVRAVKEGDHEVLAVLRDILDERLGERDSAEVIRIGISTDRAGVSIGWSIDHDLLGIWALLCGMLPGDVDLMLEDIEKTIRKHISPGIWEEES